MKTLNNKSVGRKPLGIGSGRYLSVVVLWLAPALLFGQEYSINWYRIAGGGGISTGAVYTVSATVGQPEAGGAMNGGNYSLTGGFWALYAVPTAGLPRLVIIADGPNSVQILWPATGSYTLQQNPDLRTGTWVSSSYSIITANGTNSVTISPPGGTLFFRLSDP